MKVLHFSSTGLQGGAGTATGRLHAALRRLGVDSSLISLGGVHTDDAGEPTPAAWPDYYRAIDLEIAQSAYVAANRTEISNTLFSLGLPGPDLSRHPAVLAADIIHLHWVNGLLGIPAIGDIMASGKPIVWTFHDQWPFTGGCHYSAGCNNFATGCAICPQLRLAGDALPRAVFADKLALWAAAKSVTVVALTKWMESCVRKSLLFSQARIRHVPNGLDLTIFTPNRRNEARHKWGIRSDTIVCLFVSQSIKERRKGYPVLKAALATAMEDGAFRQAVETGRITFACLGHDTDATCPVPLHFWGWTSREEEIADSYAAADVFLAPSLEDNLPNTVAESLACGTPVIGSSTGGIPEMLLPGQTGILIPAGKTEPLAQSLIALLKQPDQYASMRAACRRYAEENYSDLRNAESMVGLYEELLEARPKPTRQTAARPPAGPYGPAVKNFLVTPPDRLPTGSLQTVADELGKEIRGMHDYIMSIEADRATRLQVIEQMQHQLAVHGEARHAAEARIAELEQGLLGTNAYLATVEADRDARLTAINSLTATLQELQAGHDRTNAYLATVEADRDARLTAINSLTATLQELQAGHDRTVEYLHAVEADSAKRLAVIHDLQNRLDRPLAANDNPEVRDPPPASN